MDIFFVCQGLVIYRYRGRLQLLVICLDVLNNCSPRLEDLTTNYFKVYLDLNFYNRRCSTYTTVQVSDLLLFYITHIRFIEHPIKLIGIIIGISDMVSVLFGFITTILNCFSIWKGEILLLWI